ncbi:MAG TPA: hypothetical protein VF195_02390 [Actinomycetota bacterium]
MIPRYSGVRARVAIFALLIAAAGLGFVVDAFRGRPEVREPVVPLGTGTIAYVAFDGATLKWSLFTVEADGSSDMRIAVDLPGEAFHPSWSPDGTKLAFDVQSGGDTEIYVATIYGSNGSNLSKLTTTPGWNFLPAWSPGSRIAYVHTSGPNHDIWLMNADGSNPVRLTHDPDFDLNPTWSPDGTKLAFESNRTASPEIYVMNADGSHVSRLTRAPGFDGSPAWSPDGRQIAFVSDRDEPGIYLMASDGSHVRKLLAGDGDGPLDPEWSPDGALLAYSSSPGPEIGPAISVIDPVSGHTRVITETAGELCCPSWRRGHEPVTGTAMPGTCDYGPWMELCPEASWARHVLGEAGYPNVDDTGTVFEVPVAGGPVTFNFWGTDPLNHGQVQPIGAFISAEDVPVTTRIHGVAVYRIDESWAWSTRGLNVWARAANPEDDPPGLSLAIVRVLVLASQRVPYPP